MIRPRTNSTSRSENTPFDSMIAGAIAGGVTRLVAAPLDLVKIRYQIQPQEKPNKRFRFQFGSIFQKIKGIHSEEGVISFWRGNVAATTLWISYSGVQFGCYHFFNSMWPQNMKDNKESFVNGLNGGLAGMIATIVTYPFDLSRTIMASQGTPKKFSGSVNFSIYVYNKYGIGGFYRGIKPALIQIAPYMGLSFGIYSSLQNRVANSSSDGRRLSYAGLNGAIAGFVSKVVVYPLDTIKKRMQVSGITQKLDASCNYKTIGGSFRTILYHEGIAGFYRGTIPSVIKSVVSHSCTFLTYEIVLHVLRVVKN